MPEVNAGVAATRAPDVKVFFAPGDYGHALSCYYEAQRWAVDTSQCFREDIYATINHPHHPQCRVGAYDVPPELIEQPGWSLTVDYWVADDAALTWLKSLPLPAGAELAVTSDWK